MSFKSDRYLGNPGVSVDIDIPLSSSLESTSETTAATSRAVKDLRDKTDLDKTELLSGISDVSTLLDETVIETERINEHAVKIDKDLTERGFNIRNFILDGETTHSNAFQRANDYVRQKVLSSNLGEIPSLRVPAGTYVIDKTVKMSPYLKIKSEGIVRFNVTVNGIAFHISHSADDPTYETQSTPGTYNYLWNKNAWNRGKYFDGSNGGFLFTCQLDRATSNTVAIAIGKNVIAEQNDMKPTSRYCIENVNIYGFNKGMLLYAVDNYLGNFKNCHLEGNQHHVQWTLPGGVDGYHNSGENQVWESCIFALSTAQAFIIDASGSDFTFENCSFDFNQSPIFEVNKMGTKVRINDGHIEGNRMDADGHVVILSANNTSLSSAAALVNERNEFSLKDTIVMTNTGNVLVKNNPNATTGARIRLFLDINGLDNRITGTGRTDYHKTETFFMTRKDDNIRFLRKNIYNLALQKTLSSPNINIVPNGNFTQSVADTVLNNSGADPYWNVFSSNGVSNLVVNGTEGIIGSKCIKYTVTNAASNYITLRNNFAIPVSSGEVIYGGAFVKLDAVTANSQCNVVFRYYDANGALLENITKYDFLAHTANLTNDTTKYRMVRGGFSSDVPSGASTLKIDFVLANLTATNVSIDSIFLEKFM